jgi:hypothetical protein
VVAIDVDRSFEREYEGIAVRFVGLPALADELTEMGFAEA